jgi:hypothetical protein
MRAYRGLPVCVRYWLGFDAEPIWAHSGLGLFWGFACRACLYFLGLGALPLGLAYGLGLCLGLGACPKMPIFTVCLYSDNLQNCHHFGQKACMKTQHCMDVQGANFFPIGIRFSFEKKN